MAKQTVRDNMGAGRFVFDSVAQTVDYGTINAGASTSKTFSVAGAVAGDIAVVNTSAALIAGIAAQPPVCGTDVVTVTLTNASAGNIVVGNVGLRVALLKTSLGSAR
jgi:hypothetical protein